MDKCYTSMDDAKQTGNERTQDPNSSTRPVEATNNNCNNNRKDTVDHRPSRSSSTTQLEHALTSMVVPRNQLTAVRGALGLLLSVRVMAALAMVVTVRQYRLVIATFWIVLVVAFLGLAQILQYALLREHEQGRSHNILPRVARNMVQAVTTEWDNFQKDWREQVLLLTEDDNNNSHTDTTTKQIGNSVNNEENVNPSEMLARGKPRSRVFRALVRPLLPLLRKRSQDAGIL